MSHWGFGIEKEFPIVIGIYYSNDLVKQFRQALTRYHNIFFDPFSKISSPLHTNFTEIEHKLNAKIKTIYFSPDSEFYIPLTDIIDEHSDNYIINLTIYHVNKAKFQFTKPEYENDFK